MTGGGGTCPPMAEGGSNLPTMAGGGTAWPPITEGGGTCPPICCPVEGGCTSPGCNIERDIDCAG